MSDTLRLSSAQARELDRLAIDELGLPGIVLMENAGRGAAEVVLELLRERSLSGPVAIVCGPGNNGGDGFVLARHLEIAGVPTCVVATSDRSSGDAGLARGVLERDARARGGGSIELLRFPIDAQLRSALERCTLVVDALLGTGAHGAPRGAVASAIELVEELGRTRPVVALDVPSGLDADTGASAVPSVRADVTVTFGAEKQGFSSVQARERAGRVVVASIGVTHVWIAGAAASPPCAPRKGALR